MTLVTRSALRLSRRGGQAMRTARANAAFFNTAANQAQNALPKFVAQSSRINMAVKPSEWTGLDFHLVVNTASSRDLVETRDPVALSGPADVSLPQLLLPVHTPRLPTSRPGRSKQSSALSSTSTLTLTTFLPSSTRSMFSLQRVSPNPLAAGSSSRSHNIWVRTPSGASPWTVRMVLSAVRRSSTPARRS